MVYREKRPFHPQRFMRFLQTEFPSNIIRSKGLFWLADRPDEALNFSQAGGSSRMDSAGVWWCSMSYAERTAYLDFVENKDLIEAKWDKDFGDRLNELVFIGQDLEKERLKSLLDACLLDDFELSDFKAGKFEANEIQIIKG
jgi:G3E family GTPase